jgi:lipoic acid synthetase
VVVVPEDRRLLRLEARNSQTPIEKKPPWIKARLRTGPEYLALKKLVAREGLHHATVTGVARDDLPDGAAWLYAETCRQIHVAVTGCGVELLIPDFNAGEAQLALVFAARPEVLAHNLETVPRIFKRIRPAFRYERSLAVLARATVQTIMTHRVSASGRGLVSSVDHSSGR